jgi:hypothetical protein
VFNWTPEKIRPQDRRGRWINLTYANGVTCIIALVTSIMAATVRPINFRTLITAGGGSDPTGVFMVVSATALSAGFLAGYGSALCYVLAIHEPPNETRGGHLEHLLVWYVRFALTDCVIMWALTVCCLAISQGLNIQPVCS